MKVALVCVAKNEDTYIQEWINYNKKLGFDDIVIYQNDWRCSIEGPNLIKVEFDGINQQMNSYNHFVENNYGLYDWVAFFDVDEFLVLKKHNNIKDFISDYSEFDRIGINWVLFGDNGIEKVDKDYNVLKRFTKRQSDVNQHIKCIVNYRKGFTMGIHNPYLYWADTNKVVRSGPFNINGPTDIAQLNHYFCKTKEEFIEKCNRGRADATYKRNVSEFDAHNFNDIEDLTAVNFMYQQ
jgi:Glycosyltransferase family 92